jgi:hypothetical protein
MPSEPFSIPLAENSGPSNANLIAWVNQTASDAALFAQHNRIIQDQQALIRELAKKIISPNERG